MIFKIFFLIAVIQLTSFTPFKKETKESQKGREHYAVENYEKAEAEFSKASERLKDNPQAHYNTGNAKLKRGDIEGAIAEYGKALETGQADRDLRSRIFHNMANGFAMSGKYKEAENLYIRSLIEKPDEETAVNLEIVRRLLEQQEQEQEQEKNEEDKENQEEKCEQEKEGESEENQEQNEEKEEPPQEEKQRDQESKEEEEKEEEKSTAEEKQPEDDEEEKVDSSILNQFNQRKNLQISPFMLKREERSKSGQTW